MECFECMEWAEVTYKEWDTHGHMVRLCWWCLSGEEREE